MAWFEMLFNISGHPWDLASVCLIIILWVCFTENMGTKVSDLLRPLSCTGFTVLFFICNYCNYFFFLVLKIINNGGSKLTELRMKRAML